MRKLIYISIVHAPQELGSYLEKVKREYIARYGAQRWYQHLRETEGLVEGLWQRIREKLMVLLVDYNNIRLYQDGLPVCGRELEIVNKLAHDGSKNHQLLLELVEKGATVMGTEDPNLLIQERDRLINPVCLPVRVRTQTGLRVTHKQVGKNILLYDELMQRRDEYIAQRIASTLKEGEIGLLFMGALHRVVEKLPDDIEVHNLFDEIERRVS